MGQYIRHSIATLEQVIPAILNNMRGETEEKLVIDGRRVGASSLRLRTFARSMSEFNNLRCTCCGLDAKFFAVESFTRSQQPSDHINLYGVNENGEEVLFTHDHRLARCLGGVDNLSNTQVMCFPCNSRKGSEEGKLAAKLGLPHKKRKKKHGTRNT